MFGLSVHKMFCLSRQTVAAVSEKGSTGLSHYNAIFGGSIEKDSVTSETML